MSKTPIQVNRLPGGNRHLRKLLVEVASWLDTGRRILVSSHESPDGDAIGSTLALVNLLRERGKEAIPYNRDGVPYNFCFLPGATSVVQEPGAWLDGVDLIVLLDCASLRRVDSRIRPDRSRTRIVCLDHHDTRNESDCDLAVFDSGASSVGEILYRLFGAMNATLSTAVAECLYVSVHTDTGGFRYQNTTRAALTVAAELVKAGVDVWKVTSEIYENHPPGRVKLLSEVLDTLHISPCGRIAFLTVTQDMYRRTGTGPQMLDGFINYARGLMGVEVAGQLRELTPDKYRVSFRSRGRVDVARLAQTFGGGGHRNAAGCTIEGEPAAIISRLTEELGRLIEDGS